MKIFQNRSRTLTLFDVTLTDTSLIATGAVCGEGLGEYSFVAEVGTREYVKIAVPKEFQGSANDTFATYLHLPVIK